MCGFFDKCFNRHGWPRPFVGDRKTGAVSVWKRRGWKKVKRPVEKLFPWRMKINLCWPPSFSFFNKTTKILNNK